MPESIHRSSLDGCAHTLDLDYCVLCYGWLRPYHIYHVLEISVVLLYAGSPAGGVFNCMCSCKEFHPSLSLRPHTLGGICTSIFHCPCYPSPTSWRTHSGTWEKQSISPLYLSRASCFKGHMLHSNLSPSLLPLSYILEDSFWDLGEAKHFTPLSLSGLML